VKLNMTIASIKFRRFLLIVFQAIVFALILTALYGKIKHDRYYKTITKVQDTQISLSISMLELNKAFKEKNNDVKSADLANAFEPISSFTPIKVYRAGSLIFEQTGSHNPLLKEDHRTHALGDFIFVFGMHKAPAWFIDKTAFLGVGRKAKFWKWVLDPKNWFSGYYDYIHVPFLFFLIIFISFRYSYVRILGLGRRVEKQKIEKLELCLSAGETKFIEYKQTLSLDITSNTKEKYIEAASLKTICAFMNSEGGTLLIGVNDSGKPLGIEEEIQKFYKSNDKFLLHFKNIIRHRIGEQVYALLEYEIREFKGVNLLVINCQKSDKEIFMNSEEFYVRTNPATDRLEGKRLLEYCRIRFGLNA